MFITHEAAKVPRAHYEGECSWAYTGMDSQVPWLYVIFSRPEGEGNLTEVLFLAKAVQLFAICSDKSLRIECVYLVSPDYLNRSDRTKMELLLEIWLKTSKKNTKKKVYEYVVESGNRYRDRREIGNSSELGKDRLIFKSDFAEN